MTSPDLLGQLQTHKLLAILRGVPARHAPKLVDTLRRAGIHLFEVALSDEHGLEALSAIRTAFPDLTLGAGTVINTRLARQAREAGATFLVTPHLCPDVNVYAVDNYVDLLAGAMTPTEISFAYAQGATAVKVFPAGTLGPDYFRHLRGPYPHLPLLAVGGVNAGNLRDYLNAGAVAAGIGGAVTSTDWNAPDWQRLRENAAQLVVEVG